ncbi:uncharacterized protein H6S33_006279 [Morchella sextelata]|uniref:uncharacterized protein n=1 Tax=Morchella sextelata TaxID=1174677 RepID=UPI001D04FBE3|nr:uncharacterized protein H6S33_006279 [Morchella sextelata]KAH0604611.1 hypothetical protein H6S33_006279 [Morchella sextelata]
MSEQLMEPTTLSPELEALVSAAPFPMEVDLPFSSPMCYWFQAREMWDGLQNRARQKGIQNGVKRRNQVALSHPATLENLYHDIQRLPPKPESFHCSQYALSKSVDKKPVPISTRSKRPFKLIQSYLSGKFGIQSQGKAQYYMSFIDDYTPFAWIYLLKHKEDSKKAIKDYVTRIEKQYNTTILRFRMEYGGEYINKDITNYFDAQGIVHEQTLLYTPESNGVAERFNKTVTTMVRCMIIDHPKSLWGGAYSTAVYLKNRLPYSMLKEKTPFEALKGTKPSIQHLQLFGIIVGYSDSNKIYRIWIGTQHRVIENRDVIFPPPESGEVSMELNFISTLKSDAANTPSDDGYESEDRHNPEPESSTIEENLEENSSRVKIHELDKEIRRQEYNNKVIQQQKSLKGYIESVREDGPLDEGEQQAMIEEFKADFRKARKDLDLEYQDVSNESAIYRVHLKKAIQTEKDALDKAHTWDIVNRLTNRAVMKEKWVFKVKPNADRTIEQYKARYVAKGFTQVQYRDYNETFTPIARYDSLRLLLVLAEYNGWTSQQIDIKSAFLYSVLKEELDKELPEGYRVDNKVYKLRKCIYGLKQSPREWYACLADSIQQKGFVPAKFDPCVFIHKNHHLYISVYIDDIMKLGSDSPFRKEIRQLLKADFKCTHLGNSKFILGIEITVTNNGITQSQRVYINKILDKFGMSNCKPVGTPLELNLNFHKYEPEDQIEKSTEYQSIIGSLITKDWNLFYLKGTTRKLNGFSDSSYASDLDDRKSFSGYVFRLKKSVISWRSWKQKSVAVSTIEAEYIALSLAARQLVWICNALHELQQQYRYFIYADNTGSIELCWNSRIHDRFKHINIHYHYTRKQLETRTFETLFIPTEDNFADIMIKGLPKPAHQKLSELIRYGK